MRQSKILFFFRHTDANRLTMPVLFNIFETCPHSEYFQPRLVYSLMDLINEIPSGQTCVAAWSFMTPHVPEVWEEVKTIRRRFGSRIFLIGGGPHAAGDPESVLAMGFDAVALGEGEATLPAMMRLYLEDKEALKRRIISSGAGDPKQENPSTLFLNESPVNLDESVPIARTVTLMSPLEITRGCFWQCRFCQTSLEKPRYRSLKSVAVYFEELKRRKYLFRAGFIAPSGFEYASPRPGELNLEAVEAVLKMGKLAGVKHLEYGGFPSELRPNAVSARGFALIRQYASNRKVTIGAQSGSDETLKKLRRGHSTEDIEQAAALAREAGITPMLDFILGFPGETEDEQLRTLEFARRLYLKYHARTQLHFFMPLSGTPLEEETPTFFSNTMQNRLDAYNKNGICTNWWKEGMAQSREIIRVRQELQHIKNETFRRPACD